MFRIIDVVPAMLASFASERFNLDRWKAAMDAALPGAKALCLADMEECLSAGYTWENDFLPVLNDVIRNAAARDETVRSFRAATDGLEETILSRFGRAPDVDVILYLGLCNGAGWATEVDGRAAVLLGIEKIMELGWYGLYDMQALILHELGHQYHAQFGSGGMEDPAPDQLLWQLFSEGVATVFEQEALGNADYYHQDVKGWKQWCEDRLGLIAARFAEDLPVMTPLNQNYFGDWVRFDGQPDVGSYLGTRFVRFLLTGAGFDRVIRYSLADIRAGYDRFLRSLAP